VLDIGEDQFLVLLLVMQAQRDDGLQAFLQARLPHGSIDMGAIGKNLVQPRTGQQTAAQVAKSISPRA